LTVEEEECLVINVQGAIKFFLNVGFVMIFVPKIHAKTELSHGLYHGLRPWLQIGNLAGVVTNQIQFY